MPHRQDLIIRSVADLETVVGRVSFKNSLFANWNFTVKFRDAPRENSYSQKQWFLWVEFDRPDTHTGKMGTGRGRDEIVYAGATESSVMKTIWLCVELLVRHELMEGFRYEDLRVFDPHNTIGDLQLAQQVGSRGGDQACTYMEQQAKA